MSEWITDRKPTEEDCKDNVLNYHVWVMHNGKVEPCLYSNVVLGFPWHPIVIEKPEPYVAPKPRYTVAPNAYRNGEWAVEYDKMLIADKIPTKEAAERIAAIYNEVMP